MRIMDSTEVEERLFAVSDAKLHGEMCKVFSATYCKILSIFPSLEAARPRSKCGIQALCSLHVALEKAKSILQHCSECSKLYLAITGESVVLKFNKARYLLIDSLRRVEDIVPQSSGCQIFEIVDELEGIVFSLDPLEKQMGDQIIALLQQGRRVDGGHDNELESFHQAVIKLGITSSRAALAERRALKKLRERACRDEDKRKESIVSYLLHLMRKYSNLFRSELIDDIDSLGSTSTPCSPTVHGSFEAGGLAGNSHVLERQLSKLTSFNFRPSARRSGQMLLSPEELRCPISLQLMYDPVIIASGQTYERVCIENWFADGHVTCPKTQQKLAHLCLTPNYCVKGLISSWCEQNGISVPDGPPESLDLNYWRLVSSESDSSNSRSMGSLNSSKLSGVKVVPLEDSGTVKEGCKSGTENQCLQPQKAMQEDEFNVFEWYQDFLTVLNAEEDLQRKCKVVERVRFMLKDDEETRIFMGGNGFVEALLQFLRLAVRSRNALAQETGAMALFNLSVNNRRNKEMILAAGVIPVLETMISNGDSAGSAIALYLLLSCLKEAKSVVGSSKAVPFLVRTLESETETQCKLDALHCLYNLSSESSNIPKLLSAGIIHALLPLLALTEGYAWTEKSIAVLINLASTQAGIDETVSAPSVISGLTTVLDTGEPTEQEQAVSCLYILCSGSETCSQMVLQEGVIPALVSISVNGTRRGKEKAQNLLMLFREQRQRDQPSPESCLQRTECNLKAVPASESKPLCKLVSKRKMGKVISFFFKSKSYSYYQC